MQLTIKDHQTSTKKNRQSTSSTSIKMTVSTMGRGGPTGDMALAFSSGHLGPSSRESIKTIDAMVLALSPSMTSRSTRAIGLTTLNKAAVCSSGPQAPSTLENSKVIKCTVKASFRGKMGRATMAISSTTRRVDKVSCLTKMVASMKASGKRTRGMG